MSEIPTAGELVQATTPTVSTSNDTFRIGAVSALFPTVSTAKIIFDGEIDASEKQYAYLSGYVPTVNDRVLLARVSGTWVILGKIGYNATPPSPAIASTPGSLVVNGVLTVAGNLDHNGTYVGFFGVAPAARDTVTDPNATTTTAAPASYTSTWGGQVRVDILALRAKQLEIVNALQSYGLL